MNFMHDYEFIAYKPILDDEYIQGIATVRICKRFVVRYALKKTKDGGSFFAPATHSAKENGERKYYAGFKPDSEMEGDFLIDFIKENAQKAQNARSVHQTTSVIADKTSSAPIQKESGFSDEQLPF